MEKSVAGESTEIHRTNSNATVKSAAGSNTSIGSMRKGESKLGETGEENEPLQQLEETSAGKVEGSLLINYFLSARRPFLLTFIIVSFLLAQVLASSAGRHPFY